MSPLQVAFLTVFGTILVILLVAGKAALYWMQRDQIKKLTAVVDSLDASTAKVTSLLEASLEACSSVNSIAASLAESAQLQVAQLEAVAKSVTVLRRTLLTGQTEEESYDEQQINAEMEVEQLVERGIPRQEAEKRVAEKNVWERFNLRR